MENDIKEIEFVDITIHIPKTDSSHLDHVELTIQRSVGLSTELPLVQVIRVDSEDTPVQIKAIKSSSIFLSAIAVDSNGNASSPFVDYIDACDDFAPEFIGDFTYLLNGTVPMKVNTNKITTMPNFPSNPLEQE